MTEMREARIRIEENGDSYQVSLFDGGFPSAGAAPLKEGLLNGADLAAASPTAAEMREGFEAISVKQVGERLFQWLDAGSVASTWAELEQKEDGGLRTYLDVCDDLADLPWEALAVPSRDVSDFVAFRPRSVLLRTHESRNGLSPVEQDALVRILIVTGNRMVDAGTDADEEAISIERAFQAADRCVHIEVLREPADKEALLSAFVELRPHIFHFIGHGGRMPGTDKSALLFSQGTPQSWPWSFDDIFSDMCGRTCAPRLVFLNACHSGQPLGGSISTARAFGLAGVPALVGMQQEVQVGRALELTRSFYGQIAAGQRIDKAMWHARRAVKDLAGGVGQSDWVLPILSVAEPPEKALEISAYREEVKLCDFRKEMYTNGSTFVDRASERRKILALFAPFVARAPSVRKPAAVRGLVVSEDPNAGLSRIGKSWLVKRTLGDLAMTGFQVRYCEIKGGERPLDYREVLQRFRHGDPQVRSFVKASLPDTAFTAYDAAHARALAAGGQGQLSAEAIDALFNTFLDGLRNAARAGPLVLVLDQFTGDREALPPMDFKGFLLPKLFTPILEERVENARVVFVMNVDEMRRYGISDESGVVQIPQIHAIRVSGFRKSEARRLFLEFCRFKRDTSLDGLFNFFESRIAVTWSPASLAPVGDLFARLYTPDTHG